MAARLAPVTIRYYLRGRPALALDFEASWDTYGFALRDGAGEEHHFGLPASDVEVTVFTFIASYTDDGRDTAWPGGVHDKLTERGYELVEPIRGPRLTALVVLALDDLADFARHKGFAFDPERELAVRTFAALQRADEAFDPEEVYVWGATHGFERNDADRLREYARRSIEGGGTRTVSGHAIRVDGSQAERMVEYWRRRLRGIRLAACDSPARGRGERASAGEATTG